MEEIRICVMGNVDSAKSTLISTLTHRILDDGRGLARKRVFKHKHEQESGRTSDISFKYIKVNPEKYITFIDLAGHEKYFKTTIHGINGGLADFAILLIGANMGVLKMTKEHLGIIKALKIPFCVALTKIDICPEPVLDRTTREITRIISRNFSKELVLQPPDQTINLTKFNPQEPIKMFQISNVTGHGLEFFRESLYSLENRVNWEKNREQDTIMWIDNVYLVKGIGVVLSGTLKKGEIKINDRLLLGPSNVEFQEVIVNSIHNNFREDNSLLRAGVSGCVNIKATNSSQKELINKKKIKKGMVLIGKKIISEKKNKPTREFMAQIHILHHPSTIRKKYEPVVHIGKISQTAKIVQMTQENLRTGDKAKVKFRFKYRAEFIEMDDIMVFREGRTKGIGKVVELL